MKPARCIIADPGWKFSDKLGKRGAAKNYLTEALELICKHPLPPIDEDGCLLILWRVGAMQREALEVCSAWGFKDKAELVWCKLTKTGKPHFGMGRTVRYAHETALIATRGRFKVDDRAVRSVFYAQMPLDARGRIIHSAKPDEVYRIAKRLCRRGPHYELFARKQRRGWIQFGNELGKVRTPVLPPVRDIVVTL